MNPMKPLRCDLNLIIEELTDEVLLYDRDNHRAFCLNRAAVLVWRACDGNADLNTILRHVGDTFSLPDGDAMAVTELALFHLQRVGLITGGPPTDTASTPQLSRRQLAGRLAIIPIVLAIIVPTAASAVSCLADGSPCVSNVQCCSNRCPTGTCLAGAF